MSVSDGELSRLASLFNNQWRRDARCIVGWRLSLPFPAPRNLSLFRFQLHDNNLSTPALPCRAGSWDPSPLLLMRTRTHYVSASASAHI